MRVWTIGHSNGPPDSMLAPLRGAGLRTLCDIRTVPKSRRVPWASIDELPSILREAGIAYAHIPELGGLRKPRPDSVNDAWENEAFRGYADHLATGEFETGMSQLLAFAEASPTCVMCAEAVPWRCHRSILADVLTALGVEVVHLIGGRAQPHEPTAFARFDGPRVTYPAGKGRQTRLI